jgi:hypothetical protein
VDDDGPADVVHQRVLHKLNGGLKKRVYDTAPATCKLVGIVFSLPGNRSALL